MLARQETYPKQRLEISFKQELQRPFDLQRIAGKLANLIAINFEKLDVTHESALGCLCHPTDIYHEHLSEIGERAVMLFRPAMMPDVDSANLWAGARAIWSQWDGYLRDGPGAKLKADLEERKVPFESIHTSGHASIADLKRLAKAIGPKLLVPIHTFEGDRFSTLFENVARRKDGEWWGI